MFYRRCPEGEGAASNRLGKKLSPGGSEGGALRPGIRSGGMYGARSDLCEGSEAKAETTGVRNRHLADFAPGSAATAKSEIVTHLIQMLEKAFE